MNGVTENKTINTSEIDFYDYAAIMPHPEAYEKNANNFGSVKDLLTDDKDANGVKLINYIENCFICNRPMDGRKAVMVHLATVGGLIPADIDDSKLEIGLSQGCFPIGASCAAKIPAKYRIKR